LVGTCKVFINVLLFVQSQDWCLIFQFLVLKTTCFFHSMLVKYLNPVLIIFSAHDDILKPKCAFLLLKPPFFIPNQLTLEAIGSNAASSVCGAAPEGAQGWRSARRLLAQLAEDGLRATAVSCWAIRELQGQPPSLVIGGYKS
jgi:hypothetical protein